ncbi:MAG: hypothetical protein WDO13_19160 [Verrucomicrobiota bacterium]
MLELNVPAVTIDWMAGTERLSSAMMAMTVSISTTVKPRRAAG